MFAHSYVTNEAGAVAAFAEERKFSRYSCFKFYLVVCETSGVFGPVSLRFLRDLGHRLRQVSGDRDSYIYLIRASPFHSNSVSVLGSVF